MPTLSTKRHVKERGLRGAIIQFKHVSKTIRLLALKGDAESVVICLV